MAPPASLGVLFLLVGLAFGSFGNVLIHRLPDVRGVGGRSTCPRCGKILRFLDLIPIVSFLLLRAKCRACQGKISWQYPFVEIVSGLLFLAALSQSYPSLLLAILLAFSLWFLLLIFMVDARTEMIPDAFTVPFFLLSLFRAHILGTPALLAAAVGGGFFALQWIASRGKWVGSGDILLAAGIGAFLGSVPLLVVALTVAYASGAIYAALLVYLERKTLKSSLAFGPFLIVGALVSFWWGDVIIGSIFGL